MILAAILRAIKVGIDAIAKAVAWLLMAFGLWVPLVYSLVFVIIVTLFTDVPLVNTGASYFVGLFISFIIAMWVSMVRINYKKRQKPSKRTVDYNVAEVKKKKESKKNRVEKTAQLDSQLPMGEQPPFTSPQTYAQPPYVQPQYAQSPTYAQPQYAPPPYTQQPYAQQPYAGQPIYGDNSYTQPMYGQPPQSTPTKPQFYPYNQPQFSSAEPPATPQPDLGNPYKYGSPIEDRFSDMSGYDKRTGQGEKPQFMPYNVTPPTADDSNIYASNTRATGNVEVRDEEPKVFGTRSDPTVFIYEYSDRLDYYRRTRQGLEFMKRVMKGSSGRM